MTDPAEPDGVDAVPSEEGSVTVVGTAHVSAESAERV